MPGKRKDEKPREARMASAHLRERREARYAVPMEIEVSGIDRNGEVFHERTLTRNVSEWGCGFLLPVEVQPDDILALRVISGAALDGASARQSMFQVVRVEREEDGWVVGAWKMDGGNVWGTELEKIAEPEEASLETRKEASTRDEKRLRKDADQ